MKKICLAVLMLVMVSACGEETQKTLGLKRDPIDEFTVVRQAPLTLPPKYELRPPRPGQERPQSLDNRDKAEDALFSDDTSAQEPSAGLSSGEAIFLEKSGGLDAPDDIRQQLDARQAEKKAKEDTFLNKWNPFESGDKDPLVDPEAEEKRLQDEEVPTQRPVKDAEQNSEQDSVPKSVPEPATPAVDAPEAPETPDLDAPELEEAKDSQAPQDLNPMIEDALPEPEPAEPETVIEEIQEFGDPLANDEDLPPLE